MPAEVVLRLDPGRFWRLSLESDAWWAAPVTVSPAGLASAIRLRLYPAARLVGRVLVPEGAALPETLDLRLEDVPEAKPTASAKGRVDVGRRFAGTVLPCPIVDRAFSCWMPAGELSFSLRVRGYRAHYFWARTLEPGQALELGALAQSPGASLVGFVVAAPAASTGEAPELALAPESGGSGRSLEAEARRQLRELRARADARGFFHFDGLEPGLYALTARRDGFAPTVVNGLAVVANAETRLREAVVLTPPLDLAIQVEPAVTPQGEPWRLGLHRDVPGQGKLAPVGGGLREALGGHWSERALAAGRYWLEVRDDLGNRVHFAEHEASLTERSWWVKIESVAVEGTLRWGSEPLAAQLVFGGRAGATRMTTRSDEAGHFAVQLPRSGFFRVDVMAPELGILRTLRRVEVPEPEPGYPAQVEIVLGSGRIEGRVLDEAGQPAEGAMVTVFNPKAEEPLLLRSGPLGRFEAAGLEVGAHQLGARRGSATARPVEVEVVEGPRDPEASTVELKLQPRRRLDGRLVGALGQGVPGARVEALPTDAQGEQRFGSEVVVGQSDLNGRVALELPSFAEGAILRVVAPGYALRQLRLRPLPEASFEIAVSQDGGALRLRGCGPVFGETGFGALSLRGPGDLALPAPVLVSWSQLHGAPSAASELLVPALEPGLYRWCSPRPDRAASCRAVRVDVGTETVLEPPDEGC